MIERAFSDFLSLFNSKNGLALLGIIVAVTYIVFGIFKVSTYGRKSILKL